MRIVYSRPDAETVIVSPAGEADICTVPGLRHALWDAIGADGSAVVVDLDHLTFMDASTLNVLVHARRRAVEVGKSLRVGRCNRRSRRLLAITGLDDLLAQSA